MAIFSEWERNNWKNNMQKWSTIPAHARKSNKCTKLTRCKSAKRLYTKLTGSIAKLW